MSDPECAQGPVWSNQERLRVVEMNGDLQEVSEDQFSSAFQYVAGELSAAENEAFEQRLLLDSGLCEAVAEAVLVTSAVAAVRNPQGRILVNRSAGDQQERVRWRRVMAVSAAVCLCAVVALTMPVRPVAPDLTADAGRASDEELLVLAWAESLAPESQRETDVDELLQTELDVPEWLLAAVSLSEYPATENAVPLEAMPTEDMEVF